VFLRLVLELGHPGGLAKTGDAVQDPGKLGVLGHLGLDKERAFLHVHAACDVLGRCHPGASRKLRGILRHRDGVQVRDKEDGVILILHPHPVHECAEVVSEVEGVG
jgi:hypothetical protein